MAPYPITFAGKVWKTSEALFQALRFEDESIQELLRSQASPMGCKFKAKAIANELKKKGELHKRVIEPGSKNDVENMEFCLRLKLNHHSQLLKQLLETGSIPIYEDATSRTKTGGSALFWGAAKQVDGSWKGENMLGKIWMKIREEEQAKSKMSKVD